MLFRSHVTTHLSFCLLFPAMKRWFIKPISAHESQPGRSFGTTGRQLHPTTSTPNPAGSPLRVVPVYDFFNAGKVSMFKRQLNRSTALSCAIFPFSCLDNINIDNSIHIFFNLNHFLTLTKPFCYEKNNSRHLRDGSRNLRHNQLLQKQ